MCQLANVPIKEVQLKEIWGFDFIPQNNDGRERQIWKLFFKKLIENKHISQTTP